MTMFYAPASGGVRTYLEAKHRLLQLYPGVRHSILVPGSVRRQLNGIYEVPAPVLPFGRGQRFPLRQGPWCERLQELGPDLIEVGDPYLTAWAALTAGRRLDVPVIGFYHSDLPLLASNRFGPWIGAGLSRYVARLYERFDRVLVPSRVMADKLDSLGIRRLFVQPLGVDLQTFNPAHRDPAVRRELGVADRTHLLIYAGRGSREKNLDILLDTLGVLGAGWHLLLVGSNMPRRVPDNVTVIDRFCSAREVARLLASCDALLHAGTQETFGLVALEAMACGIPVVAARAGALPELVPSHCGRLCPPRDAQAMARAVRELFEADARRLGLRARQHVEAHHAWDAVVAGLLAHYHAMLGRAALPVAVHV